MQLQFFKDNFYDAVFQHTRKLFWPSMGISILTALFMALTLLPLVFNLFPQEVIQQLMSMPQTMDDMKQNSEKMEAFFKDNMAEFVIFYIAAMIIGVFLLSYGLRVGYAVSKRQLEGENSWFGLMFTLFDKKLLKMMGFNLIMMILGIASLVLATSFAQVGVIVFFLALVVFIAYILRFVMAAPAIIIADMDIREGMRYSVQTMGWGKSFKLLFFIFVVSIAAGVTAIILSLLMGLILGQGIAGNIASNFLLLFVNAAVFALLIAGSAGLIYRYGSFETPSEPKNPEDKVSLKEPE